MLLPADVRLHTRHRACHLLLSIALTTPVAMPGLYGRRPLFEDRPPPVLVKPAQLYARPEVGPCAGLYRHAIHPGSLAPVRRAVKRSRLAPSCRATIYRSGRSAVRLLRDGGLS